MLENHKKEIFERLGKEIYKLGVTARKCRQLGEPELATQTHYEIFGVQAAVEALGFSVEEFTKYYNENRRRFRQEFRNEQ